MHFQDAFVQPLSALELVYLWLTLILERAWGRSLVALRVQRHCLSSILERAQGRLSFLSLSNWYLNNKKFVCNLVSWRYHTSQWTNSVQIVAISKDKVIWHGFGLPTLAALFSALKGQCPRLLCAASRSRFSYLLALLNTSCLITKKEQSC